MFSAPTAAAPGTNGAIASIATIVCTFVVIILLAGTIVLALIPLYPLNKSVSSSATSLNSKEVTMVVDVEQNSTTVGRRRRTVGDLSDYVGGEFGSTGRDMVKAKFRSFLPSSTLRDIYITSVSIGYKDDTTKKRFVLSKRVSAQRPVVTVFKFYMMYVPSCLLSCQTINGPILRATLVALPVAVFIFTQVPIYKSGALYGIAPRIQFVSINYVSAIIPGLSPSTIGTSPVTGSPAINTTAAITTAAITTTTISAGSVTTTISAGGVTTTISAGSVTATTPSATVAIGG